MDMIDRNEVWAVGALVHAVADALDAKFNPVAVRGEITGFARAASGHCYFVIKDDNGQLRCAMFRRAATLLAFEPKDGEQVQVRGRLGVYEPRGDLQLVVESMVRVGQGALFEQFLRLKAKLAAEGLFDAARKRALPTLPRGIGVVTSLDAAALHDVMTALRRRAPHIPVVVAPAAVQGAGAAAQLAAALQQLYRRAPDWNIDVILLVRGGGSIEDLWSFNDETLARTIAASPVPVVCGVGHETDFTIADFVADVRAPTPTAAAELAAAPVSAWLGNLALLRRRLVDGVQAVLDRQAQRLDRLAARLGRPSGWVARERLVVQARAQRLHRAVMLELQRQRQAVQWRGQGWVRRVHQLLQQRRQQLQQLDVRLQLLDPRRVLQRGYAWLQDEQGGTVSRVAQTHVGQRLLATLADGQVDLAVRSRPSG